jgi:hypothetical protein
MKSKLNTKCSNNEYKYYSVKILKLFFFVSILLFENVNAQDAKINACATKAISDKQILADTNWQILNCTNELNVELAIGESESASLVLKSDKLIDGITIKFDDFVNEAGKIMPASVVDTRIVKVWYQNEGAWMTHVKKSDTRFLTPELLLKDDKLVVVDNKSQRNLIRLDKVRNPYVLDSSLSSTALITNAMFSVKDSVDLKPFRLDANENKQLWFTVKSPVNVIPGFYKSKLSLISNSAVIGSFPVNINVLPFSLDAPNTGYAIYYRGKLALSGSTAAGFISSDFKSEGQLRAELVNIKEHGVTDVTVYQDLHDKARKVNDTIVLQKLERYLTILKEVGLVGKNFYYLGRTIGTPVLAQDYKLLGQDIDLLLKLNKKYGFESLYLYGIDEAEGNQLITQKKAFEYTKSKGAKVLAAGYDGHSDSLNGLTDVLVYQGKNPSNEVTNTHKYGNKIYRYQYPQVGVENPYVYRKNYGFDLWVNGFDGVMDYAYQHAMGFAWNDSDHKVYRDHLFTYPTINGVIDTIAWEGFREAVDDVKYLTTLENLIKSMSGNNIAIEANNYLEELKSKNVEIKPDEVRKKIANYIVQLKN